MEYFNFLSEEITLDILSRVPAELVLECKLVSTNWRSIIRHPSFSKMHLDQINRPEADSGKLLFVAFTYIEGGLIGSKRKLQFFEYNDENHGSIEKIRRINYNLPSEWHTRFIGSCNGLICYLSGNTCTICNPIIRECIMFPKFKGVRWGFGASGFGYVASTNEYKVVTMKFENDKETGFTEVYIYTIGSGNGWRNLGNFDFGTGEHWGEGVYFNGNIYWLDNELKMIVPFHLAEEKFGKHFSPPPLSSGDIDDYYKLGASNWCLYFAANLLVGGDHCWCVWILDDNHDTKEQEGHQSFCWSEEVRVIGSLYCDLFAVTKSGTVLSYTRKQINIHGPEASTSETIVDSNERIGGVFPHKNTLVSLKELGEEDAQIME